MVTSWRFVVESDEELDGRATRYSATVDEVPASWLDMIVGLRESAGCRTALTSTLVGSDADQIFWETVPLTRASADAPFGFATIRAGLNQAADPGPFRSFFGGPELAVTFANLRGDAVLVAPTPLDDDADRSYLLSFLRSAPTAQIHQFWSALGAAIETRLSDRPVWVSTSGGGVSWLHARLDDQPKYYLYEPYRIPPG